MTTRTAVEKRDSPRRFEQRDIRLLCEDGTVLIRARTENVSETGLYAVLPAGYGVHRGQHYRLLISSHAPRPDAANGTLAIGPVKIMRIDRREDENGDGMGVGMMFA